MPGVSEGVGLGERHAPTIRSKSDAVNDCHYCQFEKVVRNNVSGEIIRGVPCHGLPPADPASPSRPIARTVFFFRQCA